MTKSKKVEIEKNGVSKIVEVTWIDSVKGDSSWVWLKDQEFEDAERQMTHISCGYVLQDNNNFIAITLSKRQSEEKDGDISVMCPLIIPKVAVKKIDYLNSQEKGKK